MEEATITSKGQITIPKEIRQHLGLREGGKIVFIERSDEVVIRPKVKNPMSELKRIRETLPRISKKELDDMIKESKKAWD